MSDQFVVHRLRSQPVEYTVTITHFVMADRWTMGLSVHGVMMDTEEDRTRVVFDLRRAADLIENNKMELLSE